MWTPILLSTAANTNKVSAMGRNSRLRKQRRQQRQGPNLGLAPTIERSRRCQNCIHWDNGDKAIKHYKMLRHRDLDQAAAKILEGGQAPAGLSGKRLSDADPHTQRQFKDMAAPNMNDLDMRMRLLGLNYSMGDNLMRQGQLGICRAGKTAGDFVKFNYLCASWTGRLIPDGADEGDELSEEAKDRLGYDK